MGTAILFDFFGTLVAYEPGGASSAARCADLVNSFAGSTASAGGAVAFDADRFRAAFDETFAAYEARALADLREFSMDDVVAGFLWPILDREPSVDEVSALARTYIEEWNAGVTHPPAIIGLIESLAECYRLAVVSNTHEPDLVPAHLAAMGIADCFETVVTSVEVGWRKPHPAIYDEALRRLDLGPEQAVFVGDSYEPDFVGPQKHGMYAFLIDPAGRYDDVPDDQRLRTIDELPARLT